MRDPEALRPWLMLRAVRGLSDARVCRLVQTFGSLEAVQAASTEALMSAGEISIAVAQAVQRGPDLQTRQGIDRELKALERMRVSAVTYLSAGYPTRLKTIPDPPPLLYVSGALDQADEYAIAVVGARRPTPAGRLLTEQLSRDLASLGFTVVSGLARGMDAAAHKGALQAGGRTVAVLGCGIDRTYPSEHQGLREQIEAHGAVMTELPVGSYPHGYHFPRRNRIISGMSLGVVVTEAAVQSGSLITARLAAEQGREVFAVPGFVREENSRGPNGLIKQGAKLVESVRDIVEELLPQVTPAFRQRLTGSAVLKVESPPRLDEQETMIYRALSYEPAHIDDVIAQTGLLPAAVSALLLSLELKNVVRQLPGPSYLRV